MNGFTDFAGRTLAGLVIASARPLYGDMNQSKSVRFGEIQGMENCLLQPVGCLLT